MPLFFLITLAASGYAVVYGVHSLRRHNPAGAAGAALLALLTGAAAAFFCASMMRQM